MTDQQSHTPYIEDGFPCTNCLNKAQKGIDRYRADQEGAQGE